MPHTEMIFSDLAPELSAQLIVAATGRPARQRGKNREWAEERENVRKKLAGSRGRSQNDHASLECTLWQLPQHNKKIHAHIKVKFADLVLVIATATTKQYFQTPHERSLELECYELDMLSFIHKLTHSSSKLRSDSSSSSLSHCI